MMKHHSNHGNHHHQQQQQQQQMNGGGGVHGGPSPTPAPVPETKWWYKGPDGETYGPYTPREMRTWGDSGYFNEDLPVRTANDEQFHSIGNWMGVMGGQSPFSTASVPAFAVLAHGMQAQQFLLYPPGLPAPFGAGGAPPPPPSATNGGRFGGPPFLPNGGPPNAAAAAAAAMANLHLGGGAHMGMHPMHHGGPLSQPPSEPNDGANSSNSHTPDSAEPDQHLVMRYADVGQEFRTLHQMGMPPLPPVPQPMQQAQQQQRMQFGYGMPPMQHPHHQQQHPHQQQHSQQHQLGGVSHAPNGQLVYSRVTSTHDAPWNARREVAVDASIRAPPRNTIATQTLPVILGSKDASKLLSELTGCSIVIT